MTLPDYGSWDSADIKIQETETGRTVHIDILATGNFNVFGQHLMLPREHIGLLRDVLSRWLAENEPGVAKGEDGYWPVYDEQTADSVGSENHGDL